MLRGDCLLENYSWMTLSKIMLAVNLFNNQPRCPEWNAKYSNKSLGLKTLTGDVLSSANFNTGILSIVLLGQKKERRLQNIILEYSTSRDSLMAFPSTNNYSNDTLRSSLALSSCEGDVPDKQSSSDLTNVLVEGR